MAWKFQNPKTGEVYDVEEQYDEKSQTDLAREKAISKGYVPVISVVNPKTGEAHLIDDRGLEKALAKGYKTEENFSNEAAVKKNRLENTSHLESAARGFLQGASFDHADEITGALESAFTDKTYKEARDEARQAYKNAEEANPYTYGGAQLGGAVATSVVPLGAAAKSVGLGAKALQAAKVGAVEGALFGSGVSEADLTKGEVGDFAKDVAVSSVTGAATGAAMPLAGKAVSKGAETLKDAGAWLGKKAGRILTGVKEADVDYYLKHMDDVNAAKTFEELKEIIDRDVGKYSDSVNNAKTLVDDTKDLLNDAKFNARDAFIAEKEVLSKIRAPEKLQTEIVEAIGNLQGKVSGASGEAFDVLAKQGQTFESKNLKNAVKSELDNLKIGGKAPAVGPDAQAYRVLDQFDKWLNDFDEVIPATDVKSMIMSLDRASKEAYVKDAGAGVSVIAEKLANVRNNIDSVLKTNEAYRSVMAKLAPEADLLSKMSKTFGSEDKVKRALRLVSQPDSVNGRTAKRLLADFDKANGTKFSDEIQEYLTAQDILKSPTKLAERRKGLAASKALAEAGERLERVKADYLAELEKLAPMKRLNPGSTERLLTSLSNGKNIEGRKALEHLGELEGKNYVKQAKDSAVLDAFNKESTQGSRKTLLGGIVGLAAGAASGNPVLGPVIGAGAGAAADKFGGKIYKRAIDATVVAQRLADKIPSMPVKYQRVFEAAARRGTNSQAATHFLLQQQDPEYRKMMNEEEKD